MTLTFVDDREVDHALVQGAVEVVMYPVRCQSDGSVAHFLTLLARGEVTQDAVVTDLNMPGPCGFDLIRALRARPGCQHLPILGLSTSPAEADREQAAALGIDGSIVKPTSYAALVEQLHDMASLVQRGPRAGKPKV